MDERELEAAVFPFADSIADAISTPFLPFIPFVAWPAVEDED